MTDHDQTPPPTEPKQVKVWDLPTRLFHWALAALVLLSYLTGELGGFDFVMPVTNDLIANMTVHMYSGLAILTLVLFRVVWGFLGSTTARFSDFVAGPGAIFRYLGGLTQKAVKFTAGHNPAGGAMVVLILLLLLVQAGTGLFAKEDDFFGVAGPLNGLISEDAAKIITNRHKQVWEIIEVLVIVHIAANVFYWLALKQNLIVAMFTGKKPLPPGATAPTLRFARTRTAILTLIAAAAVVWRVTELG
jgi:cytochrome b